MFSIDLIKKLNSTITDPNLRGLLLDLMGEIEKRQEETVTKKDFNELKAIVFELVKTTHELAEAQKRTEIAIEKLTIV
ncbi:MAG: hypothetical protein HQK79_18290 [Desulfobacterales bacterium]|nr:hypothetical protein [Desulfobacterales bacterium]MBF0397775.1 hypothetical protein [Desulfobacterales bacterium]